MIEGLPKYHTIKKISDINNLRLVFGESVYLIENTSGQTWSKMNRVWFMVENMKRFQLELNEGDKKRIARIKRGYKKTDYESMANLINLSSKFISGLNEGEIYQIWFVFESIKNMSSINVTYELLSELGLTPKLVNAASTSQTNAGEE